LIAGAAQGAGLGHDFLRHIERTRLLIHLVEAGSEDLLADVAVVEQELQAYGHGLAQRPRLLVLNKIELLDEDELPEALEQLRLHALEIGVSTTLAISAAMAQGLEPLKAAVWDQLGVDDAAVRTDAHGDVIGAGSDFIAIGDGGAGDPRLQETSSENLTTTDG
jgi:GTP-binding protein